MNKKGFTLVELLMVVIIIGILVTLAVPNYFRSVERAKGGKTKASMDIIRKASIMYRAYNDSFTTDLSSLINYELPNDLADGLENDWSYTLSGATTTCVTIKSTRKAGPHTASTIVMDQDGNWTTTTDLWK